MTVIVVGAGVIGSAIAYELAARGVDVHIIDARGSGQGATRASAGILAPYIEGHSGALLRLGVCSLDQYDSFIARVAADSRRDIEYRRTGTLQVACTDAEAQQLHTQARGLVDLNVVHSIVDGADARRLEPALTTDVGAGLLLPQHGYVGVASLMTALDRAARHHGATFSVASVTGIESADGAVSISTSEGSQAADALVLAAGSWSGLIPLEAAVPVPVRPVRGQLLQVGFPQLVLSRIVWGTDVYFVPWEDGSVLLGATVEDVGFDDSVTVAGVRRLLDSGERILPAVRAARLTDVRAGLRPATADELPIVGPSSMMGGVYYATGHYRNGVLLAPMTARLVADLVIDGNAARELELMRPDRFGL